eukprot:1156745-Pelagomonas_calceolata.AAC.13
MLLNLCLRISCASAKDRRPQAPYCLSRELEFQATARIQQMSGRQIICLAQLPVLKWAIQRTTTHALPEQASPSEPFTNQPGLYPFSSPVPRALLLAFSTAGTEGLMKSIMKSWFFIMLADDGQAQPRIVTNGTRGFGSLDTRPRPKSSMETEKAAAPPCERLAAVRQNMAAADQGRGVHAFIVPTEDPHMSEYSPDCFKRREWISRCACMSTVASRQI